MRWVPWLVVVLVALSVVAWFAFGLVPFALYPLVLAAVVFVIWRVAGRLRRRGI